MLHLRSQVLEESVGELYLDPLCKNTRSVLAKLHRIDAQRDEGEMGKSFYFLWMPFSLWNAMFNCETIF